MSSPGLNYKEGSLSNTNSVSSHLEESLSNTIPVSSHREESLSNTILVSSHQEDSANEQDQIQVWFLWLRIHCPKCHHESHQKSTWDWIIKENTSASLAQKSSLRCPIYRAHSNRVVLREMWKQNNWQWIIHKPGRLFPWGTSSTCMWCLWRHILK